MTKKLLALGLLLGSGATAQAQWVNQPVSFSNPKYINLNISAVDANVAWTTVFDPSNFSGFTSQFSRTVDGGTTWTAAPVSGVGAKVITSLHALSATTAWVTVLLEAGGGRVLKTTDGGTTWTVQTTTAQFATPDSYPELVHFFDANNGVVIGDPDAGSFEVYTTANGGTTWQRVPNAAIPAPLSGEYPANLPFIVAQAGNTLWFGTDANRVFKTTDRGLTWTVGTTNLPAYFESLAFRDADNGLALDDEGNLARTTNGGASWAPVVSTGPQHSVGLDNVPGTRTYISTGATTSLHDAGSSVSSDDGQTWTALESTTENLLVDFVSPTVGWAGAARLSSTGLGGAGMNKYTGRTLATNRVSAQSAGLQVAPNPSATGLFMVHLPAGTGKQAQLQVVDALGRNVLLTTIPATAPDTYSLDLQQQASGVYLLNVQLPEGLVQQKLLIP